MKMRILSVDDAPDYQEIVQSAFRGEHEVESVPNLNEAFEVLHRSHFDLILLDVALPDGDGFSFYAKLQGDPSLKAIPVVFVTAKSELSSEVMGFTLGAEDYIVKPVEPLRLRARIEARFRQIEARRNRDLTMSKGGLKICFSSRQVTLIQGGQEVQIDLTPVEFKLLFQLLKYEDQVFSRAQLLESVWGQESKHVVDRTVDMHVSNLRKKISQSEFRIQAVHGTGYRMTKVKNH